MLGKMRPFAGSHYPPKWSKQIASSQTSSISVSAFPRNTGKRLIRRRVIRAKKGTTLSSDNARYLVLPKEIPKLLAGPNVMPLRISSPPSPISRTPTDAISRVAGESLIQRPVTKIRTSKKFLKWLRNNLGVIILNSGSFATLTAFTRTDILELRLLSIAGSVSTMIYFSTRTPPRIYLPIIWSSIFMLTNTYMVYHVYGERKGSLSEPWTEEEESLYVEHFLAHGVTPRQFEKLLSKATRLIVPRGVILVESGTKLDSVYLVIEGCTMARSNLSEKVTAASSVPGNRNVLAGGDSGAWIGELAFLEKFSNSKFEWRTDGPSPTPSIQNTVNSKEGVLKPNNLQELEKNDNKNLRRKNLEQHHRTESSPIIEPKAARIAILSYTASQESVVLEWKHEDLAEILNSSVDMRASMTRAMTAAVVGKVVNLYTSKPTVQKPSTWWHRRKV